jgi:hypothetical protein
MGMRRVSPTKLVVVAASLAVFLAFMPAGRAEPQKSFRSNMDLTLSMRADALAPPISGRDGATGPTVGRGDRPSNKQELALKLGFDEHVRLVLPARQLLNIPDKEVMFVLELGF